MVTLDEFNRACAEYKHRILMYCSTHYDDKKNDGLIEKLSEKGCEGIVVANHIRGRDIAGKDLNQFADEYMKEWYSVSASADKYGIKTYFALMLRFTQKRTHQIIYGANEKILRMTLPMLDGSISDYSKAIKTDDILIIQRSGICIPEETPDPKWCDGLETFNANYAYSMKETLAWRYAKDNPGTITISCSDNPDPDTPYSFMLSRTLPCDNKELVALMKSHDYLSSIEGMTMIGREYLPG